MEINGFQKTISTITTKRNNYVREPSKLLRNQHKHETAKISNSNHSTTGGGGGTAAAAAQQQQQHSSSTAAAQQQHGHNPQAPQVPQGGGGDHSL